MEREIRGERGGGVAFWGDGGGVCTTIRSGTPGGVETSRADVSTLRVRVMEYAFGVEGMWATDGQVGVRLWVWGMM